MKTSNDSRLASMERDAIKRRILMVDDDVKSLRIVSKLLGYYDFTVDVADSGSNALLILEKNNYGLVIMDCLMPGVNGYEATAVIRDANSGVLQHDIPIIALTGRAMANDIEECLAIGMNDHLPKPFLIGNLLEKIYLWTNASVQCSI